MPCLLAYLSALQLAVDWAARPSRFTLAAEALVEARRVGGPRGERRFNTHNSIPGVRWGASRGLRPGGGATDWRPLELHTVLCFVSPSLGWDGILRRAGGPAPSPQ